MVAGGHQLSDRYKSRQFGLQGGLLVDHLGYRAQVIPELRMTRPQLDAQETRRQLGQFTDVTHAVEAVFAAFDQSAEQVADLQLMLLALVGGHSTGGLGQSTDLANSRATAEQQIQPIVLAGETSTIELCWLGLKCRADLASGWSLAGRGGISGKTARVGTKGAAAFLAHTMVSQLGEQVAQKTLDFFCPLRGGQYSVFG